MTDEQKALALLLVLGAGVVVLMMQSRGSGQGMMSAAPCLSCSQKSQPMMARPALNGATHYGNEERVEIQRDENHRMIGYVVHRDATVAPA